MNGRLEQSVKDGALTMKEARGLLKAMPRGHVAFVGGQGITADFRSSGCSAAQLRRIDAAVSFILANITDLPTRASCTPNDTNFCLSGGRGSCFGGHTSASPRSKVTSTLSSANFRINCYSVCWFHPVAYTNCWQWSDAVQDIHICADSLDGRFLPQELACIIAHEIMHVWGADEDAAVAMVQSTVPWGCP